MTRTTTWRSSTELWLPHGIGRTRTTDKLIFNQPLCLLRYHPKAYRLGRNICCQRPQSVAIHRPASFLNFCVGVFRRWAQVLLISLFRKIWMPAKWYAPSHVSRVRSEANICQGKNTDGGIRTLKTWLLGPVCMPFHHVRIKRSGQGGTRTPNVSP